MFRHVVIAVSIPQRDFGEFQQYVVRFQIVKNGVSIPQRDFGEFQPEEIEGVDHRQVFQSLKGILVNFNQSLQIKPSRRFCFNPSKGFWWISTLESVRQIRNQERLRFNPSKGFWWISTVPLWLESLVTIPAGFNPSKGFWWISTNPSNPHPNQGRWFQSLKGILVNFNARGGKGLISEGSFQSLKGILVNFNRTGRKGINKRRLVSIPQRDFGEFQRCPSSAVWPRATRFQSLKGILVNFNTLGLRDEVVRQYVSIPQRDFGEFQPEFRWISGGNFCVSIPQRDFGEFQLEQL